MEIKFLAKTTTTKAGVPHPWPFAAGTVATGQGKLITLAGQAAYERVGGDRVLIGPGDPAAQTRQTIENIKRLLASEGATLANILHMTVYLVDAAHFAACGKVAQEYFSDPSPPQTLIVVKALAWPELLVEIQVMAMVKA